MAITDNVRKALADATPLYAAAGTVDLAAEKLREARPLLEKLRDEAPERFEKVRAADPKVVQDRVAQQAKDVQARLAEAFGGVELDLKKLRENAQEFAMQQIGRAAEYAVRAGETYNGLVDRGRGAVRTWRGDAADGAQGLAVTIEPATPPATAPATPPATPPAQSRKSGQGAATNGHSAQAAKPGAGRKSPQGK
jgi:heparin binding hemagglutinin HbhA